jgi:Mg-chelatase subunit ChlD
MDFMTAEPAAGPRLPPAPGSAAAAAAAAPAKSGLKAGFSDDNEQFNLFVKFLDQYKDSPHVELAIQERIVVKVRDAEGKPFVDLPVKVEGGGRELASGRTYADGSFSIYPLDYGAPALTSYVLSVEGPRSITVANILRAGTRVVNVDLPSRRAVPAPLPVDVLFVLDTTGSMGEEIERLRSTIEIINANIASLKPRPALRFGMVLYKDREDEYVTKAVPFTADLDRFQAELDALSASGGGDTPEDLQAALDVAVRQMDWNSGGIRLGFVITDAPPHLDYGQDYDYAAAARGAKAAGIKLFGIGTGGLPLEGEYALRQIAQFTQGKYIFLTYGEAGEAAGGKEGSVSHHTGTNFTTDKLEAVVIRFVKEEIARQSDKPLEYDESYYAAQRVQDESREDTLGKLFAQALQGLADYSSFRLTPATRLAIMPLSLAEGAPQGMAAQAEYLGSQLAQAAALSKVFTMVERKDLQKVLDELELQLTGLADEGAAAKVGKLLGAEVLVTGTVFRKGEVYEVFLKLVRVETAEVLSANKAKISAELGL